MIWTMNAAPTGIIVLGGGGHARVLLDLLALRGLKILAITDPSPPAKLLEFLNRNPSILMLDGDQAVLDKYPPQSVQLVNGLGTIAIDPKRRQLFEKFKGRGYTFATLVHPSAAVASGVDLGEGVQVMAGAVIQTGTSVGPNSILNTRCSVDHDCVISAHVHLAPGVVLSGSVTIGDDVHVGTGSTVIQGVQICNGALIAAGAVVIDTIPAGAVASGVPARIKREST